jgi:hypothetical protein
MLCAACRGDARGLATAGDGDGAGAPDGEPASSSGGELVVSVVGADAHGHGGNCGNVVVDSSDLYLPGCRSASRTRAAWINLPMMDGRSRAVSRRGEEEPDKRHAPTTGAASLGGSAVHL